MSAIVQPNKTEHVDQLTVKVYENRISMGTAVGTDVAEKIKELLSKKEQIRMVFAAAPSQNEFLDTLTEVEGIDWARITTFHMDEYIGLPEDAPERFSKFLFNRLFRIVNPGEVHFIDSSNAVAEECKRYTDLIKSAPIDIVCLGIGENGHLAFNDPPVANFHDREIMKPVRLDEDCRRQQVNDGCFPTIDSVPTHALTLTIPALLSGSYLFCIVPGPTKRAAVEQTLYGPITTDCPASILRQHPNCFLYVDRGSYVKKTK